MIPIIAIVMTILLANIFAKQLNNGLCISFHQKEYCIRPEIMGAIVLLPVYIISACQFSTSSDYYNYSKMFSQIAQGIRSIDEPAIYLIFKIVSKFRLNFQWVYYIIFFLALTILYRTLKKYSKDFVLSTALMLCMFFGLAILQIRQLLAVVIIFAAYQYILKRKPIKFVLLVIIASMCHASALIMLPAYFLLRYRYRLTDILVISGICIAMGRISDRVLPILIGKFAPSRLNWYFVFKGQTIYKWDLILLAMFSLIVIIYAKRVMKNEINILFSNAFALYMIMFFFCRWIPEVQRWGYYFSFPIIALIPNCLGEEPDKKVRILYSYVILLYLFLYLLLMYRAPLGYYTLTFLS